jgi:glucose/arabinose dehydrogenase
MIVITMAGRAAAPPCDANNGGITLPQGFCAAIVADNVGAARHLAVAENGDLFVRTRDFEGRTGGVVALRDTNGDGKMDTREKFGDDGGTGLALRNGYLYYATTRSVLRYRLTPGALKPAGAAETIVGGLPNQRAHAEKGIAFDGKGGLYVNVGAP